MSLQLPWDGHGLVEAHFAGQNGSWADRRMWRHLGRCEPCRIRYRVHAMCEAAEADGERRAEERLGRGLFARRLALGTKFTLAAALLAGAAALVIVPRLRGDLGPDPKFAARGGEEAAAGEATPGPTIALYRVAPAGPPERAGAVIHAGEALAFSYTNPPEAPFSHLMIFAHDDAGHVFWYWPAWRDPATSPTAIAITAAAAPVELGEAVKHPLAAGGLTLTALFTNQAYDVHVVEAALAGGAAAMSALQGRLVHERVEVLP